MVLAVAAIVLQQLIHTPWGLPGHRGIFWLSTLIAVRWAVDRPGVATGVALASSGVIVLAAPVLGFHTLPYLVAAVLLDALAAAPVVRRHRWLVVAAAPVIHLAGVFSPLVRSLAVSPPVDALAGMGPFLQGHLAWGLAAGVVGTAVGVLGRPLLHRPARTA